MLKFKTFILKVNEGLIKTQPLYKSIEIIKRNIINIPFWYNIESDLDNNKFSIEFDGILNINQTEGFMNIVNNLGYYCSAYFLVKIGEKLFIWKDIDDYIKNSKNCNKVIFMLESKFDKILKHKPNIIYHVTNISNLNKIKKIGLVPKSKNKKNHHLDRIYLTLNLNSAEKIKKLLVVDFIIKSNDVEKYDDIFNNFIILEIDISDNYYNDIKIYYDPNMIGGYYTYQNIKPKNIKQLIQ